MKFGTKVWVKRGGGGKPGTPGSLRNIKGTLIGAFGKDALIRLNEDDPLDTVGWNRKGTVGSWSRSAVTLRGARKA